MFNQKVQKKIVSTFNKETKDARQIAKKLNVSRREVMDYLSETGLRNYSLGSYN